MRSNVYELSHRFAKFLPRLLKQFFVEKYANYAGVVVSGGALKTTTTTKTQLRSRSTRKTSEWMCMRNPGFLTTLRSILVRLPTDSEFRLANERKGFLAGPFQCKKSSSVPWQQQQRSQCFVLAKLVAAADRPIRTKMPGQAQSTGIHLLKIVLL